MMIKVTFGIFLLGVVVVSAEVVKLVDFRPQDCGVEGSVDTLRAPAILQGDRILYPLSLEKPLFRRSDSGNAPLLYGGAEVWTSGSSILKTGSSSFMRLHSNEPPSWPNEPCVLWSVGESSGGEQMFNLCWVNLWPKALFAGMARPDDRVAAGPGSQLAVEVASWTPEMRPGAESGQVRFIIKQGGQIWVSEYAYFELVSESKRLELDNLEGERWAAVSWTEENFRLPARLEFQKVVWEDVEAVGFVFYGSGSHDRITRWSRFEFSGQPASGPVSYAYRSGGWSGFPADRRAENGYLMWAWMRKILR